MTTYYVRTTGSDAAAGTSAGAAWLTIGKAVSASTASGDTIWIGAGVYRLAATLAPTTRTSETFLYADNDGSQTGDAGEVRITGYTTNDSTAPGTFDLFTLASKSFWTIKGFTLVCGNGHGVNISGTSHDLKFQDCTVFGWGASTSKACFFATYTWSATQAANWLIERCRLFTPQYNAIYFITLPASASGSDMNQNIIVRNCLILAANIGIRVSGTNATNKSGGVQILNNFIFAGGSAIQSNDGFISTTYPTTAYNNFMIGGFAATVAAWVGTVATTLDDYNYINNVTPYTNVTQGAHSIVNGSVSPHFHMGQELVYGARLRPFGMFPAGSPLLAWGAAGTVTDDLLGGPRPGAGAASVAKALGPYERNNTWVKETGTVRTGSNAISVTGPGYQDFAVPVNATSTTVTVYVRWDATYAGTKPKMQVLNGGECGAADATATATGSSGAWEQLSLNFTPTAIGIVTIRLLSSDTNGGGKAFADDFAVA